MKHASALAAILLAVAPVRAGDDWLKAPALRPGDTIAIVAPAGPADKERLAAFMRNAEAQGYRVKLPANLFRKDHYLAGSDEDRAAELNAALRDPDVRAVFP